MLKREQIAHGVYFSGLTDGRYKHNQITVTFLTQLKKSDAAVNALVPRILSQANGDYPTFSALSNRLSALYAARLSDEAGKLGDTQFLSLGITSLDDKYALDGDKITDEATDILIGCLFNPVLENGAFTEETVSLEKQTLIDEIEAELNDKRVYAMHKALEVLCEGEGAAVSQLGTVETVTECTAAGIYAAYKRLLETARVEIICAGVGNFSDAKEKLTKAFSNVKRNVTEECVTRKSPLKATVKETVERLPVEQSKMVIGMKSDCNNIDALKIMSKVYGGTTTSKLFMNVREKLSLCYYCWARLQDNKGVILIDCGVENGNIEKARAEILSQFEDMKNGNFTDDEINAAKLSYQNDTKSVPDSLSGIRAWYLKHIYAGEIKTPEQEIEAALAVSRQDIIDAAKTVSLDTVYLLTGTEESK